MPKSSSGHILQDQYNQDLRPTKKDSKMVEGEAPRGQVEDCVGLLLGVHTVELGPQEVGEPAPLLHGGRLGDLQRIPLGPVLYPATLEQLQTRDLRAKYANYKEQLEAKGKKATYTLYGFPFAFMVSIFF